MNFHKCYWIFLNENESLFFANEKQKCKYSWSCGSFIDINRGEATNQTSIKQQSIFWHDYIILPALPLPPSQFYCFHHQNFIILLLLYSYLLYPLCTPLCTPPVLLYTPTVPYRYLSSTHTVSLFYPSCTPLVPLLYSSCTPLYHSGTPLVFYCPKQYIN